MTPLPLRLAAVLALVLAYGAATASPAAADGARPTNFESVIDSVDPSDTGVRVEVVGGDSFLQVSAPRGTTVDIGGYDGDPYLRIDADGSVQRNRRSPSTYLNLSRDGTVDRFPEHVDSSGDPEWEQIGGDGKVAWHDHRIHWMIAQAPTVGPERLVQPWSLPLTVDGTEVTVSGRLLLHDDELPWAAAIAVAAAAGAWWMAQRHARRVPLLVGAALVGTVVGVGAYAVNPPDSGANPMLFVLPAVALVVAATTFAVPRTARSARELVLPLAAVALLTGWALVRVGVLWMPVIPSSLPPIVDRVGTSLVLGVAVGVGAAILARPVDTGGTRTRTAAAGEAGSVGA